MRSIGDTTKILLYYVFAKIQYLFKDSFEKKLVMKTGLEKKAGKFKRIN